MNIREFRKAVRSHRDELKKQLPRSPFNSIEIITDTFDEEFGGLKLPDTYLNYEEAMRLVEWLNKVYTK